MYHEWGKEETYTRFLTGNMRERDNWEDPDVDGKIILRWIFCQWVVRVCTGSSWLKIGTFGLNVRMR